MPENIDESQLPHLSAFERIKHLDTNSNGLVFQTLDGRRVTIRPHLLRHGFATWALNVAKEPVDIVARILNQSNLDITKYYGRPNPRLIAERSHGLMNQISSYIDVGDLVQRSPEELRTLLDVFCKRKGDHPHVWGTLSACLLTLTRLAFCSGFRICRTFASCAASHARGG